MSTCVSVINLNKGECIQLNGLIIECVEVGVIDVQGINRSNGLFQYIEVTHKEYFDIKIDEIKEVVVKNVDVVEKAHE